MSLQSDLLDDLTHGPVQVSEYYTPALILALAGALVLDEQYVARLPEGTE